MREPTPLCETCKGTLDGDDPNACFGSGRLCRVCGYYRLDPKSETKKFKISDLKVS